MQNIEIVYRKIKSENDKHRERCSISCLIKEIQIKIVRNLFFSLIKLVKGFSAAGAVRELILSSTFGRGVQTDTVLLQINLIKSSKI